MNNKYKLMKLLKDQEEKCKSTDYKNNLFIKKIKTVNL